MPHNPGTIQSMTCKLVGHVVVRTLQTRTSCYLLRDIAGRTLTPIYKRIYKRTSEPAFKRLEMGTPRSWLQVMLDSSVRFNMFWIQIGARLMMLCVWVAVEGKDNGNGEASLHAPTFNDVCCHHFAGIVLSLLPYCYVEIHFF